MKDEEVKAEAERLGIDISDMTWNERHSVISKALAEEEADGPSKKEYEELKRQLIAEKAKNKEYRVKYEDADPGVRPTTKDYLNLPIEIAPYIDDKGTPGIPKGLTLEELNHDVIYDDNDYVRDGIPEGLQKGQDISGTFSHKGYRSEKVIGTRGDPCFNAGLCIYPKENFITVYTGDINKPEQEGYLWRHVKSLLKQVNGGTYLAKYRGEIYGHGDVPGQIFQIKGRYALPKEYVHNLMQRITREERARKMEEQKYQEGLNNG